MKPFFLSSNMFSYSVQRLRFCSSSQIKIMTQQKDAENPSNYYQKKTITTKVDKFQQLLNSESADGGWDKCWEQGLTPWDLGRPTPILVYLREINALPKGRALIPGCGSGYDVTSIACPERYVVGLDISECAIKKAKEAVVILLIKCRLFYILEDRLLHMAPK